MNDFVLEHLRAMSSTQGEGLPLADTSSELAPHQSWTSSFFTQGDCGNLALKQRKNKNNLKRAAGKQKEQRAASKVKIHQAK